MRSGGKRESLFARTQHEAVAKLRALNAARDAGITGRDETLEKYVGRWLEQRDPRLPAAGVRQLRWTTWSGYESRMRRHVLPSLGATRLSKLTPDAIRERLAALARDGLSATTIACTRDTLATILERAVKDRVLAYNPAHAVDSVQRSRRATFTLTATQAGAFLRAAEGDPYSALFVIALHAGLRQSELLGLEWGDLDLERGTLTVRRSLARVKGHGLVLVEPKTKASAATIPLAPRAVAALRTHRDRVVATDRLPVGLVFTTELGTPVSASNLLRRHFYPICSRAGIPTRAQPGGSPGLRFHDLRHACGSLLIQAGVRPKDVQTILRHSKVATTMDLYVHAFDEDLRGAVASLDRAIGS